jgi:hypothetical protein
VKPLKCPACGRMLRPYAPLGTPILRQLECPERSCGAIWWQGKRGRLGKPVAKGPREEDA